MRKHAYRKRLAVKCEVLKIEPLFLKFMCLVWLVLLRVTFGGFQSKNGICQTRSDIWVATVSFLRRMSVIMRD